MSLTAKTSGKDFDPVPSGIHHAICYMVVDLGTQLNETFNRWQPKCVIGWELPDERIEIDGKDLPRRIHKMYTVSLSEKANLYMDLVSWRGTGFTEEEKAGFDLRQLIGINCQLNITHTTKDGKTYANIAAVVPIKKDQYRDMESKKVVYAIEDGTEIPEDIPQWISDKIKASGEMTGQLQEDESEYNPPATDDMEIPF